ncbi:MAG: aldo/keto reductase [Bryobacterales bacterium]|nr:aldo/keto reductase [Bryobacterales bacterium]
MSFATPEGTARYASRFSQFSANRFYRTAQGLTVSSLGIGTYLGDTAYTDAILEALSSGINFIDTSLNYRNQESELDIGRALRHTPTPREEYVLSTKAGYLVPNAIPVNKMGAADIVGRMHSMAPAFLEDQLGRSLANLGVDAIDVFYLHNPETQLQYVNIEEFLRRTRTAFECLEHCAADGKIRWYGMATWNGFRTKTADEGLPLRRIVSLAEEVGGRDHRFRFIQLPFNLAMMEALTIDREDGLSVLQLAAESGITVIASASLLQSRLAENLPDQVAEALPGLPSDALRSIQFTRSAPGIATALVGMSNAAHVRSNMAIANHPPADLSRWFRR